ncbi:MAG: acetate--CoA ligase family protein [Chloroflexota bacterium]|nr:acetate--CoA ligase family protein [Chloroflexota bacterium]
MDKIFYPDSVAVIGVSEQSDNLAAGIIDNLLAFGYEGAVHGVGLCAGEIHGIPIHPSVDALPAGVDLAVILTPAATGPDLLAACGRKGIHWAVIESGSFSEFSEAGRNLEWQVSEVARRWGIRFVGPNCISVVNMENGLCLPFARIQPQAAKLGPVSVLAQSGGVSITYLILLSERGPGANKVVSMGNKDDLDEVDYLTYLLDDPGTEMICLYLKSMEEGRRLLEIAASSPKPVIVQKANRGAASAQIAFSHTAALANDDRVVDAALRQAGVARAATFDEAVALAQGLSLPPVRGNDLLIVSRSGGHAVVAADVAEAEGFQLMPIPDGFLDQVRRLFRADVITPTNPLDLGAIFDFDPYSRIVERILHTLDPHALLLVHTYSSGSEAEASRRLVRHLGELSRGLEKPLAFCAFAQRDEVEALKGQTSLPIFTEIEAAVRALAASRDRHTRPCQLLPLPSPPSERPDAIAALLAREGVLTADTALDLCAAYGIRTARWAVVEGLEGAQFAASAIGYPVALKGLSAEAAHKSDAGLVTLDVGSAEELQVAFADLMAALHDHAPDAGPRIMVQQMLPGGDEVIVGGKQDPSFGPVVMFGLGGIHVEILEDVAFRLAPLTRAEAERMIDELRGGRLLRGVRGEPPADVDAIVEALMSMSRLLVACPEIVEIDVNPLLVFEAGAVAVDARAVVRRQET